MDMVEEVTLGVGDIIEGGALLGGISDEQVLLQAVEDLGDAVKLDATFYGVHLGTMVIDVLPTGDIKGGKFTGERDEA